MSRFSLDNQTPADRLLHEIETSIPEIRPIQVLAHGGQSVLVLAEQKSTERLVALKILDNENINGPRQLERFAREVRFISNLDHPNIIKIHDSGVLNGRPYLVVEYMDGWALDDFLVIEPISPKQLAALFGKILRAVNHAHQKGIIHRDLKPSNIMIDDNHEPHLLDFGLAAVVSDSQLFDAQDRLSLPGQIVGTLCYLSPEQARGDISKIDTRSDIYALGVILFESLTGALPYDSDFDGLAIHNAIVNGRFVDLQGRGAMSPLSHMPVDLRAIIIKALRTNPNERYQSADAMADDLDRFSRGEAVRALSDQSRAYAIRKAIIRFRWPLTAAAILIVSGVLSGIVVTQQRNEALKQRDTARSAAQLSHNLINRTLGEINNAIKPLAGGDEARRELHRALGPDLQQLSKIASEDVSLKELEVGVRVNLGEMEVVEGRHSEAIRIYQTAVSKLISGRDISSLTNEEHLLLIRAWTALGEANSEPVRNFEQAIRHCTQKGASDIEGGTFLAPLLRAGNSFGSFLIQNRDYRKAKEINDRNAEILSRRNPKETNTLAILRLIAEHYENRAAVYKQYGDWTTTESAMEQSLDLYSKILSKQPADADARHSQTIVQCGLFDNVKQQGRLREAKTIILSAIENGQYLVLANPSNVQWRFHLARAYARLGLLQTELKSYEESLDACQKAFELIDSYQPGDASSFDWQFLKAACYRHRGVAKYRLKDTFAAAADFQIAIELFESLMKHESNDALRQELANTLDWAGQCAHGNGCPVESHYYLSLALAMRIDLLRENRDLVECHLDVILSRTHMATWHLYERTAEDDLEASVIYDEIESQLESLYASGKLQIRRNIYFQHFAGIKTNRDLIDRRSQKRVPSLAMISDNR